MARNQRKYNTEYKVQAVKLSNEIGSSKAAVELGIPVDTLYGWVKAGGSCPIASAPFAVGWSPNRLGRS